ncbi:MAG: NAD(P)-binding protein [Victivallales bacterium]|nr:NAD(P)-binding protein [Victivallales bacterium]
MKLSKIEELQEDYDVIIAGGGLGGLTAANILGANGHRVLLAEQHFQLGGLATWFKRKGHVFDVALHGFPIGMKKTLRKYWSKELAEHIVQVKSIRYDNPQFSVDSDFTETDFTNILVNQFEQPREHVQAFYKELAEMNFYDDRSMSNRELFDKYFPGRNDIVRLLMEPITYANGSTLDEPAITYGIVFSNFMSKGVYTFLGGTDLMINMMEAELLKNNVDVIRSATFEKVIVENGKVAGAVINGRKVKTKTVLSNGNLLKTIHDWTGDENFSGDFMNKVNAVRLNNSSCQVYMGLKKGESFDYIGDLLFTSTKAEFDPAAIVSRDVTSRTYSVYYPEIRPGSDDYTVVASMNADYKDWAEMPEAEYKQAKQRLIDDTIAHLDKYIPGIADKIDYVEAATPRTFERYTLHHGGASFGTKFEGLEVSMELPGEIGGLFHTGSVGIIMSGWLGAANYGAITANNVDKYLFSN